MIRYIVYINKNSAILDFNHPKKLEAINVVCSCRPKTKALALLTTGQRSLKAKRESGQRSNWGLVKTPLVYKWALTREPHKRAWSWESQETLWIKFVNRLYTFFVILVSHAVIVVACSNRGMNQNFLNFRTR